MTAFPSPLAPEPALRVVAYRSQRGAGIRRPLVVTSPAVARPGADVTA